MTDAVPANRIFSNAWKNGSHFFQGLEKTARAEALF